MKKRMTALIFLIGLAFLALLIWGAVYLEHNSQYRDQVFSNKIMWQDIWAAYKLANLESGTFRTMDKQQNLITTSEGEGYTMLRAVWEDDRVVFDRSWQWTKDNLGRKKDKLLAWKFGQRADGSYGLLTDQGGDHSASDADTDLALALIEGYARWGETKYLYDAKPLLKDIWDKLVIPVNGKYVLASSELEQDPKKPVVLINPSYFSPYAYRIFAKVDPDHEWNKLADVSLTILEQTLAFKPDGQTNVGLPPDWINLDKKTGALSTDDSVDSNYGYESIRIPWKLYISYVWGNDLKARELLNRFSFLEQQWEQNKKIYAIYSLSGVPLVDYESNAAYGGFSGYLLGTNAPAREEIFQNKLLSLYNKDSRSWSQDLSYYDDNWVSFGIGAYIGAITDYTKSPGVKF